MNELGWALIHFIWQGAALGALLALGLRTVPQDSPNVRYALGCLTLGLMAGCVPATTWYLAASPVLSITSVLSGVGFITPYEAAALDPPMLQQVHRAVDPLLPWLVGLWVAVAVVLLVRIAGGWLVARRRVSEAVSIERDMSDLVARVGIAKPFEILASPGVEVPHVFGWLKPVVMLPAAVLAGLPREQLEAIIAHELVHIRRHDYLVNLLQTVVESVLFYHPIVWWASSKIREEREACCDDEVVAITSNRVMYSRALLALEESRTRMVPAATGSGLARRIARILGERKDAGHSALAVLAVVSVMLTGGVWLSARSVASSASAQDASLASSNAMSVASGPAAGMQQPAPAPQPAPVPQRQPADPAGDPDGRQAIERQAIERAEWQRVEEKLQAVWARVQDEVRKRIDEEWGERAVEITERMAAVRERMDALNDRFDSPDFQRSVNQAMEQAEGRLNSPEFRALIREATEGALRSAQDALRNAQIDLQRDPGALSTAAMERARRTRTADQRWSEGDVPGSTTPRGRVYVRNGPPDETVTIDGVEIWRYKTAGEAAGGREYRFDASGNLLRD